MDEYSDCGEALLRAFLELTATIWDRQMVAGMTFNEAVICNLLSYQMHTNPELPMTATELCEKTNTKKSQMNGILTNLEKKGYLTRLRSRVDRRQICLSLTEEGQKAYQTAHAQAAALLSAVVSRMGQSEAQQLTKNLILANATVQEVLSHGRQKGYL
jgi:DNA-binding MarR family transcriptional regulator